MGQPDIGQRRRATSGLPAGLVWSVLGCAVVSFGVTLFIAWRLDRAGAFAQNNLMFKDDCATGMMVFSEGWESYNTFRHPNIHLFVGLPIRLSTEVVARILPVNVERLRHTLALIVSPIIGALVVLVVAFVLVQLQIDSVVTVLLTCLATASFSHLVFSSIPTHFGFSALIVAVLFALFLKTPRPMSASSHVAWLAAGFIATGITSVNLASWAMLYAAACLEASGRARWKSAVVNSLGGAAIVVLLTVLFNTILSVRLYGESQLFGPSYFEAARTNTALYLRGDVLQRLAQFPEAFVMTFIPGALSTSPIASPPGAPYPFVFTFSRPATWQIAWFVVGLTFALLAGLGVRGHLRHRPGATVCLLAFGQILLSALVLLVYGDDSLFLYSQHWQPAVLIVFAGAGLLEGMARRVSVAFMSVLLVLSVARSAAVWGELFAVLRAHH